MKQRDVTAASWTEGPPPRQHDNLRVRSRRRRADAHFGPGTLLIGFALLALGIVLTVRLAIFFV